MNSLSANLYLDIAARIKSQVPEIEWIEQDFGQEIFDKWRPNVAFPAVLIDFPEAEYSNLAHGVQLGVVTVTLRLLVAPFTQSYDGAPLEVQHDALAYFDLEQKLVAALHNWAPDNNICKKLIRRSVTTNNRNDIGLRIRNITFTTSYEENLQPEYVKMPLTPNITAELMQ
ncbi:MAG: hypothetical protein LBN37_04915 [Bacteroidales bacterium]|jgi:hypothetical protein|nr:hypothetical protein [Bacteroidales bacterium]